MSVKTADMVYLKYADSDNPAPRFDGCAPMILMDIPIDEIDCETLPCWSVGRLIEIIKICSNVPIDWTGGLNEEREILEVIDSTLYALCLGKHIDFSKLEE